LLSLFVAVLVTSFVAAAPAQGQATQVPVTVTITEITQIGTDIDPGIFQGPVGDFYADVTIDGTSTFNFAFRYDFPVEPGVGYVFPFTLKPPTTEWTFTRTVNSGTGSVPVTIKLYDQDSCNAPGPVQFSPTPPPPPGGLFWCPNYFSGWSRAPDGTVSYFWSDDIFGGLDDLVDTSPTSSEALSLSVNLADAKWSGDVAWPRTCAQGTGGEAVRICFEVNTISASPDNDRDALLDAWEQHGINGDGDSALDFDLPAAGANPGRRDIFVEVDCLTDDANNDGDTTDPGDHSHCPTQPAMTDAVRAFANAPVPNVDGSRGIQLHIDTGPLFGAGFTNVVGGVTGTVGNHGGGNAIDEPGNTVLDYDGAPGNPGTNFYTVKAANFNANRSQVFRYSIFGHQTNSRAAVNDCTSGVAEANRGNDFMVTLGGGRDLDGNGSVDTTCWTPGAPNGIDEDGDGVADEEIFNNADDDGDCAAGTDTDSDGNICDFGDLGVNEDVGFSVGSRGEQAGTFMHELGHALGLDHGGGDGTNNKPNYLSVMNYAFQDCRVPTSPAGATTPIPGGCDYSRFDIDLNETSLDSCAGVNVGAGAGLGFGAVDFNGDGVFNGATCVPPSGNIAFDINGDGSQGTLNGFDDWTNVFYAFQGLANFGRDDVANPNPDEPDPETIEDARRLFSDLFEPQLLIELKAPTTIAPGQTLPYTVDTTSQGHGPALDINLLATKPDTSIQAFALEDLIVGATTQSTYSFQVPNDACPQTLTSRISATFHDFVGATLTASDTVDTKVLDVTPPHITVSLSPSELRRPNHKLRTITADITATDECDPTPTVTLLSITSNEPDSGLGHGDRPNDIVGATIGADDRSFQLRRERRRGGTGRVYTVVYQAADTSGNTSTASATVVVPRKKDDDR
jgi:hypothetical protein